MYRPNSIKTLMSLKREKEEALSKSLSFHEKENKKELFLENEKFETFSNPEVELFEFDIPQIKHLLQAVNETLQNLKTWKKMEKIEFEKNIRENDQKIKIINCHEEEIQQNSLDKELEEMEKLQQNWSKQIENHYKNIQKNEMNVFLKEYEDSFKQIKETNQKLEHVVYQHQNFYGKTYENDIQYQFFQTAVESLNLENLKKKLNKWQENSDEFYRKKLLKNEEQMMDMKKLDNIQKEKNKIQEQEHEDSKISQKIRSEIEEIDKELEELEKILA